MKKPTTIFDKQYRLADRKIQGKVENTTEKENADMLLRKYNTEIFDPEFRELEKALPEEIENLMSRTLKSKKPILFQRNWSASSKIWALAASLALVCGIAFYAFRVGDNTSHNQMPSPDYRVRGQGAPAANAAAAVSDEKQKNALAYLVDVQGNVKVVRTSKKEITPSSCEVLYKDDVVVLAAGAKAKIMYEDAFFEVSGAKRYQIQAPDPVIQENGKIVSQRVEPSITTRGNHLGLSKIPSMIMPPRTLLAQVVTPITRAGNNTIPIYSPQGASYTDRPDLKIGGDPQKIYTVTILEDGEAIGRPVNIKGQMVVPWSEISNVPIKDMGDAIYEVKVQYNGKIVNGTNSSFWRLSKTDRERMTFALRYIDSMKTESARIFFKANTLYMNRCYSEAILLIGDKIYSDEPLIEKIKQDCEKKLNK